MVDCLRYGNLLLVVWCIAVVHSPSVSKTTDREIALSVLHLPNLSPQLRVGSAQPPPSGRSHDWEARYRSGLCQQVTRDLTGGCFCLRILSALGLVCVCAVLCGVA